MQTNKEKRPFMRPEDEVYVYNSLFIGGFFMVGLGIYDLFDAKFHRAGPGLIALGAIFAVISFIGVKRTAKRDGTQVVWLPALLVRCVWNSFHKPRG